MSRTRHVERAVSLVLLIVLSAAAGPAGVAGALAGGGGAAAAAPTAASVTDATEYGGNVELALDGGTGSPVQASNVRVWVDGAERSGSVTVEVDGTNGRLLLGGLEDVPPTEELVVSVDQSGDLQTGNVTVTATGGVVRGGGSAGTFPGTPVAYLATGTDVTVDLFKDGSFFASRGTGKNSRVYVLPTGEDTVGTTYRIEETDGGGATTKLELRDLDLSAEVDATSITADESVTVSVGSRGSNRPLVLEVVDLERDAVARTVEGTIQGDGTGSVTLDDLSEGRYRVRVVDANSGITTTTVEVTVGSGPEGSVSFHADAITDQRGDVADVRISFSGDAADGRALVSLSDLDGTFEANLTVEDDDGDGAAVLHWNTAASTNDTAGIWVSGASVVDGPTVVEPVSDPVQPAEYSLSATHGGTKTDVATVFVEERATSSVAVMTAPAGGDGWDGAAALRQAATPSDTVALDTAVRRHDWVVLRVNASGLEGYLDSADDLDGTDGLTMTIRQTSDTAGTNEQPLEVDPTQATLYAAGDDDAYYVAFVPELRVRDAEPGDAFDVTFSVDADANPVSTTDQSATTSFRFVNGTAGFDTRDGEVVVPNEADATVSGTTTFAPGTSLNVELRKEGGTSPFVVDEDVTVGPDGQWTASFDLSDRPDDQTFTATVRKADEGRAAVPGRVGTARGASTPGANETGTSPRGTAQTGSPGSTDGGSPAETTRNGGSTADGTAKPTATGSPGFGPLAALVALAAGLGAVLVRRRD